MFFPDIAWKQLLSDFKFRSIEESYIKKLVHSTEFNIAFSGGADSVAALVFVLCFHRKYLIPRVIRFFYFEHQESITERNQLIKLIQNKIKTEAMLKIEYVCIQKNVKKISQKSGLTFERAGSRLRRKYINQLNGIAVWGHNLSDWFETVVMRLPRGSSPIGIAPTPVFKIGFFQHQFCPLARMTRGEVRSFLKKYGLTFWDDPTNNDLKIRRNQIRQLTSKLEGAGLRASFDQFSLPQRFITDSIQFNREIHLSKVSHFEDWLLALKALGMPHPSSSLRNQIRPGFIWGPWSLLKENWNNQKRIVVLRGKRFVYGKLDSKKIINKSIQLKFGSKKIKKLFKEKWISNRQLPLIHIEEKGSKIIKIDFTKIGGNIIFAQDKEYDISH